MTSLLDQQASVGMANSGRRRRRRGSDLLQMGWLPSTILPFLVPFIAISLKSGNRFYFLVIYRIFCFIFWEFKNGSCVMTRTKQYKFETRLTKFD